MLAAPSLRVMKRHGPLLGGTGLARETFLTAIRKSHESERVGLVPSGLLFPISQLPSTSGFHFVIRALPRLLGCRVSFPSSLEVGAGIRGSRRGLVIVTVLEGPAQVTGRSQAAKIPAVSWWRVEAAVAERASS